MPLRNAVTTKPEVAITTMMSLVNSLSMAIPPPKMLAIPTIPMIFITLEPRTFPTATPPCPLRPATTVTASSGNDVPRATIVRPITASETPNVSAMLVDPSTNSFAPNHIVAPPIMQAGIATDMFLGSHESSNSYSSSPAIALVYV